MTNVNISEPISDASRNAVINSTSKFSPSPKKRIAFLTSVPSFVSILTGEDAYKLSAVSVTRLSLNRFLKKNEIDGLDAVLFFAPSITGSWNPLNKGDVGQMRDKMLSAGKFDKVINLCQMMPLYRRTRVYENSTSDISGLQSEVKVSVENRLYQVKRFFETLEALALLTHSLRETYFEVRKAETEVSYTFQGDLNGQPIITSMNRDAIDWIGSDSSILAPELNIGNSVSSLKVDYNPRTPDGAHTLQDRLAELDMNSIVDRYLYSNFQHDFDRDADWLFGKSKAKKLLSNAKELLPIAIKVCIERARKDGESETYLKDLREQLSKDPELKKEYRLLDQAIGDSSELAMLNISNLLNFDSAGDKSEEEPTEEKRKLAQLFRKRMGLVAAFQQMWDRQARIYSDDQLNDKVNGLYMINSLMQARDLICRMEESRLLEFNVIAFPIMPTNSVRFVLSPDEQLKSVKNAMLNMFRDLVSEDAHI